MDEIKELEEMKIELKIWIQQKGCLLFQKK